MRVGNIDSWMKKRASHPDKEITNGEERRSRSREDVQKRWWRRREGREGKRELIRKKKRKKEKEVDASSKNLRRASIAAVAFAPHLLLSASSSSRRQVRERDPFFLHVRTRSTRMECVKRTRARCCPLRVHGSRGVAWGRLIGHTRAVPLSFSLINAITIHRRLLYLGSGFCSLAT